MPQSTVSSFTALPQAGSVINSDVLRLTNYRSTVALTPATVVSFATKSTDFKQTEGVAPGVAASGIAGVVVRPVETSRVGLGSSNSFQAGSVVPVLSQGEFTCTAVLAVTAGQQPYADNTTGVIGGAVTIPAAAPGGNTLIPNARIAYFDALAGEQCIIRISA